MIHIAQQDAPWIWGFYPVGYGLYHPWYKNAKPMTIGGNTLKYKKIDTRKREKLREKRNHPIYWPIFILVFLLILLFFLIISAVFLTSVKKDLLFFIAITVGAFVFIPALKLVKGLKVTLLPLFTLATFILSVKDL